MLGMKTAVFANGIGPISYESNRRLTERVLNSVDYISVRDPDSAEELVRLGVKREINLRADPAFLIEPAPSSRVRKIVSGIGVNGRYFAVSLRSLPQGDNTAAELREKNAEMLASAISFTSEISKKYGITPIILPMQEKYDLWLCEELAEAVDGAVVYCPENAADLVGLLARAEFIVGMRLHAVIFASSAGIPVVGLSYDPKVDGMMKALGQSYSIPIDDTSKIAERVIAAVNEVIEDRDAIVNTLREKAEIMRKACREDVKEVVKLL